MKSTHAASEGGAAIRIEVSTNGVDADTPPGPFIIPGDVVFWNYLVQNTGATTLDNVDVADSVIGSVTCPTSTLQAGKSMVCSASGIATPGQYQNIGAASAISGGVSLQSTDPSHYFGIEATDTDSDGISDSADNCTEIPNPNQSDFDLDGFGDYCDADFNNDCIVNFIDFSELVAVFQNQGASEYDMNGDLVVNFQDVSIFVGYFLSEPGPSGVGNICD